MDEREEWNRERRMDEIEKSGIEREEWNRERRVE